MCARASASEREAADSRCALGVSLNTAVVTQYLGGRAGTSEECLFPTRYCACRLCHAASAPLHDCASSTQLLPTARGRCNIRACCPVVRPRARGMFCTLALGAFGWGCLWVRTDEQYAYLMYYAWGPVSSHLLRGLAVFACAQVSASAYLGPLRRCDAAAQHGLPVCPVWCCSSMTLHSDSLLFLHW